MYNKIDSLIHEIYHVCRISHASSTLAANGGEKKTKMKLLFYQTFYL